MAISDYLQKLVELKNQLVSNLVSKGVEATQEEKLNSLVPKVLDIEQSSLDYGCIVKFSNGNSSIIPNYAFNMLRKATSIIIPDGITSIDYGAFKDCSSLKEINIPDSVTSIGYDLFEGCTSLENITIPESVTSIGTGIFRGCTDLTTATILGNLTDIDKYFFNSCTSLKSIVLPKTLISIANNSFYTNTKALTDVYYTGTEEEWKKISIGSSYNDYLNNATKHYNYTGETIT